MQAITIVTMLLWLLDIFMSVLTGYQAGSKLVLVPRSIFCRYLRTWALFDVVILSLDATFLLLDSNMRSGGSAARYARSLRALRFVRAMRLMRVLKFKRIIQRVQDMINTEACSICFGVSMIIVSLILANHVVACTWYTVGAWNGEDDPDSWIGHYDVTSRTVMYKYLTSLHWSLTQFTPASMEVTPRNVQERFFAVVVLLFAMLTFSSFVSALTASMSQLRNLRNDEAKQFWMLRRYLRDWRVSQRVSGKIQSYCEWAYDKKRQRVQEHDVALLNLLPPPLCSELKHETFSMNLCHHAFFKHCGDDARCFAKALASLSVARDETVFHCGSISVEVLFLCSGTLEYFEGTRPTLSAEEEISLAEEGVAEWKTRQTDGDGDDTDDSNVVVRAEDSEVESNSVVVLEGQWVSEPILWTSWQHVGDLHSSTECQVITINAELFANSFELQGAMRSFVQAYALRYVKHMNQAGLDALTDLTHLVIDPERIVQQASFGIGCAHVVERTGPGDYSLHYRLYDLFASASRGMLYRPPAQVTPT